MPTLENMKENKRENRNLKLFQFSIINFRSVMIIEILSVAGIYCKLQNCKVPKRNNKGKFNMPLFNY